MNRDVDVCADAESRWRFSTVGCVKYARAHVHGLVSGWSTSVTLAPRASRESAKNSTTNGAMISVARKLVNLDSNRFRHQRPMLATVGRDFDAGDPFLWRHELVRIA